MMSIIHSMHNEYTPAAWLIFAAMGCDIMDGRISPIGRGDQQFRRGQKIRCVYRFGSSSNTVVRTEEL